MKRSNRFMAVIAVILAFALTFTGVSIPAKAATTTTISSITVKNLPSNTLTLKAGKTFTLRTNTTSGNLKFSTSNKKIVTVSSAGKIKAVKKGSANITISLKSNAKIKKVVKVTVGQPATRVKVNKSALTIKKGRSAVIKATVGPNTTSNKKVIWKSSNSKIAKVSVSGRVTAVRGGRATITAIAADGSGKKAICRVTVRASVSSISFSKTNGKMYVGRMMQLSPVIKPADATNKKCAWSSSNDKVAVVNSAGNVYAAATGTAVITAKATDGTGKKASYKITVEKPVTIVSAMMSNPRTVKLTLSSEQKLTSSSFSIKASTVMNGNYNYNIPFDSVTTKDNKNYTIALRRGYTLSRKARICIYIKELTGTGNSKIETYYSGDVNNRTIYVSYKCEQNVGMNKTLDVNSIEGYKGICVINVVGLPAGVKYKVDPGDANKVYFSGKPTKAGTTVTTVKAVDELGNVDTYEISWNIYSQTTIAGNYEPVFKIMGRNSHICRINNSIAAVAGGSGSYTYSFVGESYNLSIDSKGKITGKLEEEGTYNLKVKITDANNEKISTIVGCVIKTILGSTLMGYVRDKNGNILDGASVIIINKDNSVQYELNSEFATVDRNGQYYMSIIPGTYDVKIKIGDDVTYIGNRTFGVGENKVDLAADVTKIAVKSNNEKCTVDDLGRWTDEYGRICGWNGYVYLVPGTYELTAEGSGKRGVISAKVTSKTTTLTADVNEFAIDFGNFNDVYAEVGMYYRYVPKKTGTYYFYSVSYGDPKGYLYDENKNLLMEVDDAEHSKTTNKKDFYMSYNCEAGKSYYIKVSGSSVDVYVRDCDPNAED
jgi:uncharacterized protein YjdB